MYDIDQNKLNHYLTSMEKALETLKELKGLSEDQRSEYHQYAAERCLHICIEVVADVGNMLIDGFIMRDPGSYEDIVEILRDEQVVTDDVAAGIKQAIQYRKTLVHHYPDVHYDDLLDVIEKSYGSLNRFSPMVREYVKKELF
ncbi:MAG: DUF86 domain-containing protein [Bacillaceae bacterium]|nr:DUF86 domain-containing protein [Bacillaceae bacterium]